MDRVGKVDELAPEDLTDALVSETHAENRPLRCGRSNHLRHPSGFERDPRPRGQDERIMTEHVGRAHRIVSQHVDLLDANRAKQVNEIEREGVEVVDDEELHCASAVVIASRNARSLLSISSVSVSGTESSTTPDPA